MILHGELASPTGAPLIDVSVDIQPFYREYLSKENGGTTGIAIPEAIRGKALIDTGASMSCVAFPIAEKLQLMRIGAVTFRGVEGARRPGESGEQAPIFGALLEVPALQWSKEVRLVGVQPDDMHIAIIGRDLLDHFRLEYDGPGKRFRLFQTPAEAAVQSG